MTEDGSCLDFEMMTHFQERKNKLSKLDMICPSCNEDQIQLIAFHKKPAKWRCRICSFVFEYEPGERK